jgi:cation/acetate symporter
MLGLGDASDWWFGISPEGIGSIGMLINFAVTLTVSRFTPPPPPEVQRMVEEIRLPSEPHREVAGDVGGDAPA